MGQFEAANAELRKAQELDPLSPMIFEGLFENYYYCTVLTMPSRPCAPYGTATPSNSNTLYSHGRSETHTWPKACTRRRKRSTANWQTAIRWTCCFFDWLRRWRWKDIARKLALFSNGVERKPDSSADPVSLARVHVALGETDAAMAWLQRAYQERDPDVSIMRYDPDLAALAADPRFQELVKSVSSGTERADAARR